MSCRICQSENVAPFSAREHLARTGEAFTYIECRACGCLHISEIPSELGKYYGGAYGTTKRSRLKQAIRTAGYRLVYPDWLPGKLIGLALPSAHVGLLAALRDFEIQKTASFLDVGSGAGRLLEGLRALGFSGKLIGLDPFLPANHTTTTGVQLRRQALENVQETFDVVTLVHTLEHIPDQQDTMHAIHRALAPDGVCLISIPVSGGRAWHEYRTNWVQLDPPRHLILHTPESLTIIADNADLEIQRVIWDSTSFQFWGSELVGKGRPILPLWRSWLRAAWRVPADCVRAARVNSAGRGDQATFVLTRKNS